MNQLDNIIDTEDRYLTFTLGDVIYGVSIGDVLEIIGVSSITEVPGMPDYVLGITNMRGKLIPVVDLRRRLQKPSRPFDERTCCIVIIKEQMTVGIIVDRVESIMEINEKDITNVPVGKLGFEESFLQGLGRKDGKIQLLIDAGRIMSLK